MSPWAQGPVSVSVALEEKKARAHDHWQPDPGSRRRILVFFRRT